MHLSRYSPLHIHILGRWLLLLVCVCYLTGKFRCCHGETEKTVTLVFDPVSREVLLNYKLSHNSVKSRNFEPPI